MAKKNNADLPTWILFIVSAALMAAGWLMKPFPLFIFLGFAPLFAIMDKIKEDDSFWTNIEFILLALVVSFFAVYSFDSGHLVTAMVQAIAFSFAFLGYSFAHQSLGERLGKFTIIFFWLGLEYVALKLPWRTNTIFLADAIQLRPEWVKWTSHTGYLGISLWILVCNLLVYISVLRSGINWYLVTLALLAIVAPIIYSYFNIGHGIDHSQMISLYTGAKQEADQYNKQGELVTRTAAWISVLILLLAFVKTQTRKK